jgi:beta-mannanase
MQNVRAYGAIPILSWSSASSPWVPGIPDQPEFQLSDLIAGRYDSYISSFAREAREWGHPFFLRFDWEMNGDWFPWSEGVNGNVPGEFVAAWRHVHDLFTADGATNATWVWCPYADANKRRYSNVRPLYPGDEYVDWTCMDGYNWGATPVNSHPWRSFAEIFDRTYGRVTKAAPRKPILIGEMASGSAGGHKALWVRNMFAKLPSRYRRVRGVVWFDGFDRGIDWPIETSLSVTRAFSKGIRRPLYRANVFRELTTAPIPPPK